MIGLPAGTRGAVVVLGRGVHRRVALGRRPARLRLPTGKYRIRVDPVRIRHGRGGIKRGALAKPDRRLLRVRVKARHGSRAKARYGTIVNPGVRNVTGDVAAVFGDPSNPSGIVLRHHRRVRRGQVLTARPRAGLPHGLLARVTGVKKLHGGGQRVALRPAGIYDVAPNMSFDVPLSQAQAAKASSLLQCGASVSAQISPYARLTDFHMSGEWVTTRVLWRHLKTGATVKLHFRASAGVEARAEGSATCSVPLPVLALQGMAGPIPVYAGFRPTASAELKGALSVHSGGSVGVTTGLTVNAVPPSAAPIMSFDSPRFDFGAETLADATASIGLEAELGVGVENAASIHADLGNSLDFTVGSGQCSWDLNLGSFSAGGNIGPFSFSTPSTPAAYHRNLWHHPCAPTPVPSAPPPPPPPAPEPAAPSLPLVRATMRWNTDADVDLYTWDQFGNLAYYPQREAIPGAELVEDIIPAELETVHPDEVFQEVESPDRQYTFGICDYHRVGGEITLTVIDPGGATRTFHHTLEYEGDGVVVTTSPLGQGYVPEPGWCHYSAEYEEYEEEGGYEEEY